MLGERLAAARKSRGLTQWDLAVALGDRYRQSTISAVERGHSSMLLDGVVAAAQELRVSVDWLLGLTDDPTPADERVPSAPAVNELNPTIVASDLNLEQAKWFAVSGDEMYPTVPDGSMVLVDCKSNRLREDRIFLYSTSGTLHVRRAMRRGQVWWWVSDNPGVRRVRFDERDEIVGEVRVVGRQTAS